MCPFVRTSKPGLLFFEGLYVILKEMEKKPCKQWPSAVGALVENHTSNEHIRLTDHL